MAASSELRSGEPIGGAAVTEELTPDSDEEALLADTAAALALPLEDESAEADALMLDSEELSTDNSELRPDRAEDGPDGSAESDALA